MPPLWLQVLHNVRVALYGKDLGGKENAMEREQVYAEEG